MVDVARRAFDAKDWLLTARCPVFDAELIAAAMEEGRKHLVWHPSSRGGPMH
jgi:hypothetical protein